MPLDDATQNQHFLKELEQAIQIANREIVSQHIPSIAKENILPLAISVARLHGNYLAEAFRIAEADAGEAPQESAIESLRLHREMYEEARKAFEALTHAVDHGYINLKN